jgi:hypothetical protein
MGRKRRSIRQQKRNRCADRSTAIFAGQAQKEIFVNEALARIDVLTDGIVESEENSPPTIPVEGSSWLVGDSPVGDWSGMAGKIAGYQSGQWLFVDPRDGLRITNRATGQIMRRLGGNWQIPVAPSAPSGGTTIDLEARALLEGLIAELRVAGIFAQD